MSGVWELDWVALAISLNNMILLLWLGLTVLLNADRRTWGIYLAGASLLLAGLFFAGHSVILILGLDVLSASLDFWWHLLWFPVILLPFGWYTITLWYTGFWDQQGDPWRLHRPGFIVAALLTLGITADLVLANPLPSLARAQSLSPANMPDIGGIPVLVILYVADMWLCLALALDVARRPGPATRMMGDLARRRARPWLIGTSLSLVAVSLLVAAALFWLTFDESRALPPDRLTTMTLASFDLVIAAMIGVATVLLGQAVARYEVFTGKTLPRRGLIRYWRNAVILAVGCGVVVSASIVLHFPAISTILLTTVIMTVFYALLVWRSFAERDRSMRDLRPFVTSQHLYDHLLENPTSPGGRDEKVSFVALCRDILGARSAQLTAVGSLAALVPPLVFPEGRRVAQSVPTDLAAFNSSQTICVPLDSSKHPGTGWAVPLWSERGLIGVLILGEKEDGGLYTQEEIEIARASGERLIDTCASAALAQQLMALQRQRLAETLVLDRSTRRILHDDVLPHLQAAMLTLSNGLADSEALELLHQTHQEICDLLRGIPKGISPEIVRQGLIGALKQSVDDEWGRDFDAIEWAIEPEAEAHARAFSPLTGEVLFYAAREAVRNAARHGRNENALRPLGLRIEMKWTDGLAIRIEDDGVGLPAQPSGAAYGQGLALHSTMLAVVGGTLAIEPNPAGGTRVCLALPREACET